MSQPARVYTTADMCLGAVPAMRGTEDWRQVGVLISDVSETLYCAGWMQHAEYDVYRLMTEGGNWGMGDAASVCEYLGALTSLSRLYGVWVTWCVEHGEEPIELDQWKPIYEQWRADLHLRRLGREQPDPHVYDDGDDAAVGDLCAWCLEPKPPTASESLRPMPDGR